MADPRTVLDAIRQRAERAHRMTCSDPDDPKRTTRYSETLRLVAALTAVLDLHRPETDDDDDRAFCTACGVDAYEEPIPWPCPTVCVIEAALTEEEK